MIKLKNILKESYNQSDVNYAMKMAFDSIPGNWHKALKRVKYSKRNKAIKLNMSSYMGPGKVLQKIVDEFNRSMGTKYKIDKNSFVKGSVTGIELREGKVTEYGGADFSKITSLQNFLTVDLDKFERGLKNSKHKAIYKKARKQFMKVVSDVAWEHSKLYESKLNEAKKWKPGDMWSNDFDYKGMLTWGSKVKEPKNVREFDEMKKAAKSFEDVNYHTEVQHLFAAIDSVSAVNPPTWGPPADKHLKAFNRACLKTLRGLR
mgnify:CR=1 FL=1